ncbi:AAA family ATPase [Devosia salina]|uniref:ATP-binding protein n=1 Tax=Devosia salina TaxID=2860336 RepID=A0ABX8WDG1_9HYPH|nr:AAA family ATPase [Devosia salina]QYO76975.1 ATP-binding protein [Devosia salina]
MFILLNGSFGVGKTTTARLLARQLRDAAISDPEQVGYVLRRLPAWMLGLRQQLGDYQDMALWRRLIVTQARLAHLRAETVIVPMAFTNLAYLRAFAAALEETAPVRRICLVAPLEVVRARLGERVAREGRALNEFEWRRSAECVSAHADPAFGEQVDATGSPETVLARIGRLVG